MTTLTYTPKRLDRLPNDGVYPGDPAKAVAPYVFDDAMVIAIDVALATGRPLLVSGNPGCGKSRLADAIAAVQGWSLLGCTLTSRTRLESLTADVDQLRRLNDAQPRGPNDRLKPDNCYLVPGVLWWAFDPDSARRRGLSGQEAGEHPNDAQVRYPGLDRGAGAPQAAVLLLDEIDKAEPDLPNDLLEPLDHGSFPLPAGFQVDTDNEIRTTPDSPALLTLITTNRERELPQAFVRRCVLLEIPDPEAERLVEIGKRHLPPQNAAELERIGALAKRILDFRTRAKEMRVRPPGTAEFLDALHACAELGIRVDAGDATWSQLERAVLAKDRRLHPDPA